MRYLTLGAIGVAIFGIIKGVQKGTFQKLTRGKVFSEG
jgi:hypothetical protein